MIEVGSKYTYNKDIFTILDINHSTIKYVAENKEASRSREIKVSIEDFRRWVETGTIKPYFESVPLKTKMFIHTEKFLVRNNQISEALLERHLDLGERWVLRNTHTFPYGKKLSYVQEIEKDPTYETQKFCVIKWFWEDKDE